MRPLLVIHKGKVYQWDNRRILSTWCRACSGTGEVYDPIKYGANDGYETYVAADPATRKTQVIETAQDAWKLRPA